MEETEDIKRSRIVIDYRHTIIQSVEHDEMKHGDTAVEREQYKERSRQLDENEVTEKEQYDNNHCEEVTGLSSDGYRHQVIEDYTREQMSGSSDYWDASAKDDCGEAATTDDQNSTKNEQTDYWATDNADECSESENEKCSKEAEIVHARLD